VSLDLEAAVEQRKAEVIARWGSIKSFQIAYGLGVDGIYGPKSDRVYQAVAAGKVPVPYGREGANAVYGRFQYKQPNPEKRAIVLLGNWTKDHIVKVKLHSGKTVRLHKLIADEFVDVFRRACEAAGETPKSVQTFVPRLTNGLQKLSMHSWGIAVDFDPTENPYGGRNSWMRTDAGQRFVQVFEDAGWTWGGRWSFKDDMHFQRVTQ